MSDASTVTLRRKSDGTLVEVLPDGSERPYVMPTIDRARQEAMTEEEIEAAALSDPDNLPLSEAELARARPLPDVAAIRRRLGMSQAAFAETFHIPLATLRDWEQRRRVPDQAARAYLRVIARASDAVRAALAE